ncbi:MAG: ribosome biogenesis GTPase Der [Candidatus Eisenbacteria bacterium]
MVAVVGRPNVGKSTLFNRLIGARLAVVDDTPGVTRDRLVRRADWNGLEFHLVDTGGWVPEADDVMDHRILEQVLEAVRICDLVLFVVDVRAGVQPHDRVIARELFKLDLPVLLAGNKADHDRLDADALEFLELGWETIFPIAAAEERGVADLLDAAVARLRSAPPRSVNTRAGLGGENGVRVTLVGRPNVGKSSLANLLLGEERMIVDNQPGTTRDAVDAPFRYHGHDLILVDTAGMRRRVESQPAYEFYATLRAMRALDRSDIAVLVLDATEPITRQDARIGSLIEEARTGVVIAVNKWDLLEKDERTMGDWVRRIQEHLPFLAFAPIVFISALTHQRIHRLPEVVMTAYENTRREIGTADLNRVLERATDHNPPRSRGSGQRPIRIYYATQVRTAPPPVALFVSEHARMAHDYLRYLVGKFREEFPLEGSPLRLVMRKS